MHEPICIRKLIICPNTFPVVNREFTLYKVPMIRDENVWTCEPGLSCLFEDRSVETHCLWSITFIDGRNKSRNIQVVVVTTFYVKKILTVKNITVKILELSKCAQYCQIQLLWFKLLAIFLMLFVHNNSRVCLFRNLCCFSLLFPDRDAWTPMEIEGCVLLLFLSLIRAQNTDTIITQQNIQLGVITRHNNGDVFGTKGKIIIYKFERFVRLKKKKKRKKPDNLTVNFKYPAFLFYLFFSPPTRKICAIFSSVIATTVLCESVCVDETQFFIISLEFFLENNGN